MLVEKPGLELGVEVSWVLLAVLAAVDELLLRDVVNAVELARVVAGASNWIGALEWLAGVICWWYFAQQVSMG